MLAMFVRCGLFLIVVTAAWLASPGIEASELGTVSELAPFGQVRLVDEIDVTAANGMTESPQHGSRVEEILGRKTRVVIPNEKEASYVTWRVGKGKGLKPGAAYVLVVDYPEDVDRSCIVINTGNETARGFHTGSTVGDALHAKYVNGLVESLNVPLSKTWKSWTLMFHLHDRFSDKGLLRGPEPRTLGPEDGFDVTVMQFSSNNDPLSAGAAVGGLRLYEVVGQVPKQTIVFPPEHLPRRHLFWREEMADGVIDQKSPQLGITQPIDWYRYKAGQMHFLGMNTFSKDLLEFGACQHWDSTAHGGHNWVYFDEATKGVWDQVVTLMGQEGFDILPYYEYSGSKGAHSLGHERHAKPLTRDDAYSHISWIENANADITEPEALADFCKMLDITVVKPSQRAKFVGVWLRPRMQMPVSFSEGALVRFAKDNGGGVISREDLKTNPELYEKYLGWWHLKRRDFLVGVRDYLTKAGLKDSIVLYTGCTAEPGVGFHTWEKFLPTDQPDRWAEIFKSPQQKASNGEWIKPITVNDIVDRQMYRKGLVSPGMNWGSWEVQHCQPADDPANYKQTDGVMLSHAFNRSYTVADPKTMEDFRAPAGLAMIRHYALNEHMVFDANDQQKMNYFVCDMERAGPYCMMAEAIAMANGDPSMIGYLVGANFGRGFPEYVRRFNANYLALPALPSERLTEASDSKDIVVRRIHTDKDGDWLFVVNTSMHPASAKVNAGDAKWTEIVSGKLVGSEIDAELEPFELRSYRVQQ
ncbi:hypothetical protein [Lacunimicrobium album]